MRKLWVSVLSVLLVSCGTGNAGSNASDSYLRDLHKALPSLSDVSDAALVAYAKDVCRHPNELRYAGFEGHGTTTPSESDGMYKVALRHCPALSMR
ncbi:MAG: hypothetical protein JWR52_3200 [Marmoricola sp.]|nr:hypothetical protein [Marmoricola sp.]